MRRLAAVVMVDVVGYSRLMAVDEEATFQAWTELRSLVEPAFVSRGARVVKSTGDGLLIEAGSVVDAVESAILAQRIAQDWNGGREADEALWLRIGVHAGEVIVDESDDIFGETVNTAARLESFAEPGGVCISESVHTMVARRTDAKWVDMGHQWMKNLPNPVRVFALPGAARGAMSVGKRSVVPRGVLPASPGTLVGREDEMAQIIELVAAHQVVTIAGVGGGGKTTLAVAAATQVAERFDGVWFVDLTAVPGSEGVAPTVRDHLRIPESTDKSVVDLLATFFLGKRALLILDNCEHVLDGAAALVRRLVNETGVRILLTSREPLRLRDERVLRIGTLPVPDDDATWEEAIESPAVRLFAERVQFRDTGYQLAPESISAVVGICRLVDGIPLAIELAAARVVSMSPADILVRLQGQVEVLGDRRRDDARHHQTMEAAVEWSYRLLDPSEQALFRGMSVFRGSTDLRAIEAVADGEFGDGSTVDLVAGLVERSLIVADRTEDGVRYRMLEMLRQFAARKLAASGEEQRWNDRHAAHFAAEAAEVDEGILGHRADWWQRQVRADIANYRAAFRWAMDTSNHDVVAALAVGLCNFWDHTKSGEGREWLAEAATILDDAHPSWQELSWWAAYLAWQVGDHASMNGWLSATSDISWSDRSPRMRVTLELWKIVIDQGLDGGERVTRLMDVIELAENEYPPLLPILLHIASENAATTPDRPGMELARRLLDLVAPTGQSTHLVRAHDAIGYAALSIGDLDTGEIHYLEYVRHADLLGDTWGIARANVQLARVAVARGNLDAARDLSVAALDVFTEQSMDADTNVTLGRLIDIEMAFGNPTAAAQWARRYTPTFYRHIQALRVADIADALGRVEDAAILHGYASHVLETRHMLLGADFTARAADREARLSSKLGGRFEALATDGAAMDDDEIWTVIQTCLQ